MSNYCARHELRSHICLSDKFKLLLWSWLSFDLQGWTYAGQLAGIERSCWIGSTSYGRSANISGQPRVVKRIGLVDVFGLDNLLNRVILKL